MIPSTEMLGVNLKKKTPTNLLINQGVHRHQFGIKSERTTNLLVINLTKHHATSLLHAHSTNNFYDW